MKNLHVIIIIILVIAVPSTGMAHGELVPKTLANLYQEYQGKLIVLGQVMSVSENNAKNLTSYDIKILDYLTRPQQASVITASAHTENKTIPVFEVGDNVQLYLDKGLTGYEVSPYSFKMDKKCSTWLGPSHLDFEPPYSAPASSTRFLDVNGNSINPSLNHEFVLQTDGIYTPLDSVGFEVSVSFNDNTHPIFNDTKQFHVQPCTYAAPTWKYTPTEDGNYTIYYKVIGGIYQDKIILNNASMTTGFTIEKSNVVQLSKNTTNFIGNDLISPSLASPLKQFKSGIVAKDVTCKENLELILKTKDNSPICVKSDTAITLIKRGWAMSNLKNFGYNPGRGPVSLEPKGSGNIIANSSSALKLSLSTNSTIIQSGHAIGITISVDNISPSLLTMNTQNNWPMQGLDLGDCSWLPMGVAILDGYYTTQNMSDGHPMRLHFLYPCPPSLSVKSFTFQPMSSSVITTCELGDWASCQPLTQTKASVAYSSFLQNKQFFNFNSGNYTIVAGDEWGHVAIQHFKVISPPNGTNSAKPKATSEIKNSSPLQLFLSIDSEYENPAEPISIDIGLNNTGSVPLTLAKSDNWPRNDMGSGLCSNLPFGISILKGYYTEQNMSSAKSLVIYGTVPCPAPTLVKSYTFEPSSSKATQECDTLFSCPGLTDMKSHLVIPDFMLYNGQHHSFDVGNYTIVGGDEWGHVVIQHFTEVYTTAYSEPLEK